VRAAGLLLVTTTLLYLPWMLTSLNDSARWLAWPFAAANLFSLAYGLVLRTIVSVLHQDSPAERMTVVVSDDGHDAALKGAIASCP
jgi:hypothetical protein